MQSLGSGAGEKGTLPKTVAVCACTRACVSVCVFSEKRGAISDFLTLKYNKRDQSSEPQRAHLSTGYSINLLLPVKHQLSVSGKEEVPGAKVTAVSCWKSKEASSVGGTLSPLFSLAPFLPSPFFSLPFPPLFPSPGSSCWGIDYATFSVPILYLFILEQ